MIFPEPLNLLLGTNDDSKWHPKGPWTILGNSVFWPSSTFLVTTLYLHLVQEEDFLLAQEEDLLPAQEQDKATVTRKVEDGQKTLFPRIVQGPLGCHLLLWLVPKSRFRGSGKKNPRWEMRFKMMQNYPLSIFHAWVRPESSPGADLSTFPKVIFLLILGH